MKGGIKWGISPRGISLRGTWRKGSFSWDIKDVISKALEMVACFHTGPIFGEHRDMILYLRYLREGEKFYI